MDEISNEAERITVLKACLKLVSHRSVALTADRELIGTTWVKFLFSSQVEFYIRSRSHTLVKKYGQIRNADDWLGQRKSCLLDGVKIFDHWPPPRGLAASIHSAHHVSQQLQRYEMARPPSIWFIGIDISKLTLDIAVCHQDQPDKFAHQQFANNTSGFNQILGWLKKQKVEINRGFVRMEHTGHYYGQPRALHE